MRRGVSGSNCSERLHRPISLSTHRRGTFSLVQVQHPASCIHSLTTQPRELHSLRASRQADVRPSLNTPARLFTHSLPPNPLRPPGRVNLLVYGPRQPGSPPAATLAGGFLLPRTSFDHPTDSSSMLTPTQRRGGCVTGVLSFLAAGLRGVKERKTWRYVLVCVIEKFAIRKLHIAENARPSRHVDAIALAFPRIIIHQSTFSTFHKPVSLTSRFLCSLIITHIWMAAGCASRSTASTAVLCLALLRTRLPK